MRSLRINQGGLCSAGNDGPGEYFGSTTGLRISRIDMHGHVQTFVDGLPSSQAGGLASGVADVAFVDRTLYAILARAGCSRGVPSIPNNSTHCIATHSPSKASGSIRSRATSTCISATIGVDKRN
jgi:hypothetical protein